MKKMLSTVWILTALLFTTTGLAAKFTASLDRNIIAAGESVNLLLTIDQRVTGMAPDFTPLEKKFEILSTDASLQVSVLNGRLQAESEWRVTLTPLPGVKGKVTIPSIHFDQWQTKPLTLTIKPAGTATPRPSSKIYFVRASVNNKKPYVQQQLIYTVKLFAGGPIANGILELPESPNVIVNRIGKDKQYTTVQNGRPYHVLVRQFAVYPQRSGTVTLNPPLLNGVAPTAPNYGMMQLNPIMASLGETVRVEGPAIKLNVRAKPAAFKNAWWLPATAVTLTQSWSTNPANFRVGDAITRTITLRAKGVATAQLPDISQGQLTGVNVYPDKAITKEQALPSTPVAIRQQKFALVPTHAGKLTLPAIKVAWWDTKTHQQKIASLPATTITVLPAANSPTPANTTAAPASQPTTSPIKKLTKPTAAPSNNILRYLPWVIAAVFLLNWLITFWLWRRKKTTPSPKQPKPTKPTDQPALKQIAKSLKKACQANDAKQAHQLFLQFMRTKHPNKTIFDTNDITTTFPEPALQTALQKLNQTLYAKQSSAWNGQEFWEALVVSINSNKGTSNRSGGDLPSLYL